MKLLIIAGPYEADRIRRAAVSAGLEAVAIEPGESLSGWITATCPDVIVLAPKILSHDHGVAVTKVRAVPRGRVPIFLVGDADEQELLEGLADGFVVRPVVPDELFARARAAIDPAPPRAVDQPESGTGAAATVASGKAGSVAGAKTGQHWPPSLGPSAAVQAPGSASFFANLTETIEADFDADIREVVEAVGALKRARAEARMSGANRDRVRDRAWALSRHARALDGDYFQVLGLAPDADSPQIDDAYRRISLALSPEALHPAVVAELEAELAEVRAVAEEASRLLSNDSLRQQYRRHLVPPPPAPPSSSSSSSSSTPPSPDDVEGVAP